MTTTPNETTLSETSAVLAEFSGGSAGDVSMMIGIFFRYLILIFENQLVYDYYLKSFYLILSVFLGLVFYLIMSLFIKAFKYEDIKLKY